MHAITIPIKSKKKKRKAQDDVCVIFLFFLLIGQITRFIQESEWQYIPQARDDPRVTRQLLWGLVTTTRLKRQTIDNDQL